MRIKLIGAKGSDIEEIKARAIKKDINIVDEGEDVSVFIYVDEYQRAKRLATDIKDKSLLLYNRKPKEIPEVWSKIVSDNKKFLLVDADYFINGNRYLDEIVGSLELIARKGESNMSILREKIVREQTRVYLNKNKDYGDSFVDQLDRFGDNAFKVVAGFKISRMVQLSDSGDAEHESAIDSCLDLMNYLAMYYMWDEKSNQLNTFVSHMYSFTDLDNFINSLEYGYNLEENEEDAVITVFKEMIKLYE